MLSTNVVITGFFALYVAYLYSDKFTAKVLERTPVVNLENGAVQGVVHKSRGGRDFHGFYGIPYAKAPVGELRFEFPQPAPSWNDILNAEQFGPQCAQNNFKTGGKVEGMEDCLTINVFIPQITEHSSSKRKSKENKLAVMVYIHGGGFIMDGSPLYRPDYFMDEDIILVTFNYRLSALGFLNSGDELIRGNMGIRDQILALKWVQKNIVSFGGDSKKVTIFGESAGGVSVHFMLLSPLAKGLFHKAIAQSGVALSSFALQESPKEQFITVAKNVGCLKSEPKEIVSCLRKKDFKELVSQFADNTDSANRIASFLPSLDVILDEHSILADHPLKLMQDGKINKAPFIFGFTSEEGSMMAPMILHNRTLRKMAWEDLGPQILMYPKNDTISHAIFDYYFRNEDKNYNYMDSREKLFENYTNLLTETVFTWPLHKSALLHSKFNGDNPIYLYTYAYHGEFSLARLIDLTLGSTSYPVINIIVNYVWEFFRVTVLGGELKQYGVCHADDLALLFPGFQRPPHYPTVAIDSKDYPFSVQFIKTWTKFAKDENLEFMNIPWESINKNISDPFSIKYFKLDDVSPGMFKGGFLKHIQFLSQFF